MLPSAPRYFIEEQPHAHEPTRPSHRRSRHQHRSLFASSVVVLHQAQQPANDVAIDNDDIGGVVTGPKGPEAGVWVIAETRDLPVRYIKSVVTDDRGRFVVPDLPAGELPGVGARLRTGGQRQGDGQAWPAARRSPRTSRRTRPPPRTTTPRSTGTRCSRSRPPISSAARAASRRG